MKLEIKTSPNTGANLNIYFMPTTRHFGDNVSETTVKVFSTSHERSILHEMGWHFSYEPGQKNFSVMFYPDNTKVTTETMLDVLRGYFGGISHGYAIQLDALSWNDGETYNPEKLIPSVIFFNAQWDKSNYPTEEISD
ncbi:hypothetical protein SEA_CASSEROLE_54 [Arthrobacter phage Casserole]|nr:hypothetical protein SEA_CASSEROLE_54 [Arthrobacter phage Casserole]